MKTGHSPKEKAGVVVYRRGAEGALQVLLVSARKIEGQWVFPVGSVEKGETLAATARRECMEESGYLVEIGEKFPLVEVAQGDRMVRFSFFLATVVGEADVWETDRQRRWLPVSQVVDALPDVFKGVVGQAVDRILSIAGRHP